MECELPVSEIRANIIMMRGYPVLLDSQLAQLYGVETRYLNRAVKRNANRFPDDFSFQLLDHEFARIKKGNQEGSHGGFRKLPFVFTQEGVAMLSLILDSERAIQINVAIMRTFVEFRVSQRRDDGLTEMLVEMKKGIAYLIEKIDLLDRPQLQAPALPPKPQRLKPPFARTRNDFPVLEPNRSRCQAILNAVADHFGIKPELLNATTRVKSIVLPRQIAIYLVRKNTGIGFMEIGRAFGGKDHTTIMHACIKIEKALEKDEAIRNAVIAIQAKL